MDYEKKYKEALEWMKDVYPTLQGAVKKEAEKHFPELKESEDERIRKELIHIFNLENFENYDIKNEEVIAWIEKQGEHANFLNKIQIGDKVTRNQDDVLVNLSLLNRVAKKGDMDWFKEQLDELIGMCNKLKEAL